MRRDLVANPCEADRPLYSLEPVEDVEVVGQGMDSNCYWKLERAAA